MSPLSVESGMVAVQRSLELWRLPIDDSGALSGSLISFASARTCCISSLRVGSPSDTLLSVRTRQGEGGLGVGGLPLSILTVTPGQATARVLNSGEQRHPPRQSPGYGRGCPRHLPDERPARAVYRV